MKKMLPFMKKNSPTSWVLIFLFLSAAFLRYYNLKGALPFQGDQGRDAIIVADIFRKKDLVFIGPVTSVGNMYLGPLYYYFMLPFLFLSYPSVMGPTYAVATLGLITVILMYTLGKELVGKRAALFATLFFTFSATVVSNTRFSWNPNPAPLVSLIMIYFTKKAWTDNPKYWILVSVCFSILIQLHYLTLLSLGGAGIIWLVQFIQTLPISKKPQKREKGLIHFFIPTAIAILVFVTSLTPLLLFDLKHDSLNKKAFISLLTEKDTFKQSEDLPISQKVSKTFREMEGRSMHILFEMSIGKNRTLNQLLLYSFTLLIGLAVFKSYKHDKKKFAKTHSGMVVLLAYLLTGILGTALYEHTIFDHYIAYLFPVTFLIYGYVFHVLAHKFIGKIVFLSFLGFFLFYNLPRMPLKSLGWTVDDIQRTSEVIAQQTQEDEKYNIVLLSESKDNYGQNYRYFLTTSPNPPQIAGETNNLDSLYIIDEEKKESLVTDSPIYDIVIFPDKTIDDVFHVDQGPDIFVLRK